MNFPGRGLVSRLFTVTRTVAGGPAAIPVFAEDGSRGRQGVSLLRLLPRRAPLGDRRHQLGFRRAVEGDVSNSFLRVRSTALDRTLCAECHGESLLEHYRNYHFPEGK